MLLLFFFSYIFSGFLWIVLFWINLEVRPLIFSGIILICSIISIVLEKNRRRGNCLIEKKDIKERSHPNQEYYIGNIIGLLLLILFYISIYLILYPDLAKSVSADISRHFGWSLVLARNITEYRMPYLLANSFESAFIYLSRSSYLMINTALVYSNLMLLLSFYHFAKKIFAKLDKRIPIFATWLFFINTGGGVGFINFTALKIFIPTLTQSSLYNFTNATTYFSINSIFGLWNVPSIMAFSMFLFMFSLLGRENSKIGEVEEVDKQTKFSFRIVLSILFLGMFLTHIAEAVVMSLFLIVISLFFSDKHFYIKDFTTAIIISIPLIFGIYGFFSLISPDFYAYLISSYVFLILLGEFVFFVMLKLLQRRSIWFNKKKWGNFLFKKISIGSWINILVILIFCYVVGLITAISYSPNFNSYLIASDDILPLFIYPLKLGLTGLLGLYGVKLLIHEGKTDQKYILIAFFILFIFIFGRFISFLNVFLFSTGYYENRFRIFIVIGLCLFAPIPILKTWKKLKEKRKKIYFFLFLGFFLFSNVLMVMFNIENEQLNRFSSEYQVSDGQLEGIERMIKIGNEDTNSWVVTIDRKSQKSVYSAGFVNMFQYKEVLNNASTPELTLNYLYNSAEAEHPYIHMTKSEEDNLVNRTGNFLLDYSRAQQLVFNNTEVKIVNSTKPSYPQITSNNALIIPFNIEHNFSLANLGYILLSEGNTNYSTMLSIDPNIFNQDVIILPSDPLIKSDAQTDYGNITKYVNYIEDGGNLIVFNTDLNGYWTEQLLFSENITFQTNSIVNDELSTINLPYEVEIPKFELKDNSNVTEIWKYQSTSEKHNSVFLMKKRIGTGNLTYINLSPLRDLLYRNDAIESQDSKLLTNIINLLNLERMSERNWNEEYNGTTDKIYLENCSITTNTLIFPEDLLVSELEIVFLNDSTQLIEDLASLEILSNEKMILQSENAQIQTGIGFYNHLVFNNSIISFSGNNYAHISYEKDNEEFITEMIREIRIKSELNLSKAYFRDATIEADYTRFENWRNSYYETSSTIRDREYNGSICFNTDLGDPIIIVKNIVIKDGIPNDIIVNPSSNNERSPFFDDIHALPYYFTSSLFLGLLYYFYRRNQKKRLQRGE
ncbi:hypothetical protein [Candidatus Lokiarchaeum ossiferum]|uniref:hypothetical protein n=1 Tax=Candidatus Lokiarchaeum ossiferum TaxID=2951803 RepID=UPI00352C47D9